MTGLIIALALIAVYWTLLYRGIGLVAFTGVTAAVLAGLWVIGVYGPPGFAIAMVLFAPLAVIFNVTVASVHGFGRAQGASRERCRRGRNRARRLDAIQVRQIREYDAMRYDVIRTDDFSQEYLLDPLSDEARKAEGRPALREAS